MNDHVTGSTDGLSGGMAVDRDERGSALVMVMLFALVVTAVGTTMLVSANTDHLISANERDAHRAQAAAVAGASYGFDQFQKGLLSPSVAGTEYASNTTPGSAVDAGLEGARFKGVLYDISGEVGRGSTYRIESTGFYDGPKGESAETYASATRIVEMVFQLRPDAFFYGILAFDFIKFSNHDNAPGPVVPADQWKIRATLFANNHIDLQRARPFTGTGVTGGTFDNGFAPTTVTGDVFANVIGNAGTITGDARRLAVVEKDDLTDATPPDITDHRSRGYYWHAGRSTPGSISGGGTVQGTSDSYQITDGEEFKHSIFRRNGTVKDDPNLNVIHYISPPYLDYASMEEQANLDEATFFTSSGDFYNYLSAQKEPPDAAGRIIIKIGTPDVPEFIYVRGSCNFKLVNQGGTEDLSAGDIAAEGFELEGGMYCSEGIRFKAVTPPGGVPASFRQFKINSVQHCWPAIVSWAEPSVPGPWVPSQTPAPVSGPQDIYFISDDTDGDPVAGIAEINGLVVAQDFLHVHRTHANSERFIFRGAQLALGIRDCQFADIKYDPEVTCTRFLVASDGNVEVLSYKEGGSW